MESCLAGSTGNAGGDRIFTDGKRGAEATAQRATAETDRRRPAPACGEGQSTWAKSAGGFRLHRHTRDNLGVTSPVGGLEVDLSAREGGATCSGAAGAQLIVEMARTEPRWDCTNIRDRLRNLGHHLTIRAKRYTPVDAGLIPTGASFLRRSWLRDVGPEANPQS